MAIIKTIEWDDGSGDKIYLNSNASEGNQTVTVSSDANTGNARTKTVTFLSDIGNITRQLTISQESGGPQYVTNGLVFWLDGIDKGSTTAWIEKINGYSFTNNGAVFNANHVYFDGDDDYLSSSAPPAYANSNGNYTIEVVYEKERISGIVFWPKDARYAICYDMYSDHRVVWSYGRGSRPQYIIPEKGSVSISATRALGNGATMDNSGSNYLSQVSQSNTIIGKSGSSETFFKGKIYSIRIYNRVLSEDEILNNFEVDKSRFNLNTFDIKRFLDSYDTSDYSYASIANAANAYTIHTSTNYCQFGLTTGAGAESYVYFNFDTSEIPLDATNISVHGIVKAYISNTNDSYIETRNVQFFSGTTAKGNPSSPLTTTATTYEVDGGTWTRQELSNARLKCYAKRGSSNTGTSYNFRLYGAVITINYTI